MQKYFFTACPETMERGITTLLKLCTNQIKKIAQPMNKYADNIIKT